MIGYELCEVFKGDRWVAPQAREVVIDPDRVPILTSSIDFGITPFKRTSVLHGRCFEDTGSVALRLAGLFDEHRNNYPSLSIKGASCAEAEASVAPNEPGEVKVVGMLNADVFDRVRQVSELLRAQGVLTEWPFYSARLKKFPNDSLDGPARLPIKLLREHLKEAYTSNLSSQLGVYDKEVYPRMKYALSEWQIIGLLGCAQKVVDGLDGFDFGVMYRGMLSNVRIGELTKFVTKAELNAHLSSAIRALQARDLDGFGFERDLRALDPDSEQDLEKYLRQVLPQIIGENLAHFHGTGCFHKYLHPGNFTIAGEIVDLDSVRNGELFEDDEMVGPYEFHYDLLMAMQQLRETYKQHFHESEEAADIAEAILIDAYSAVRMLSQNITDIEILLLDSALILSRDITSETSLNPIAVDKDELIYEMIRRSILHFHEGCQDAECVGGIVEVIGMVLPRAQRIVSAHLEAQGLGQVPDYLVLKNIALVDLNRLVIKIQQDLRN